MNSFCSPANENNQYCFSEKSLKKMVSIWNSFNTVKITITNTNNTNSSKKMYNSLNNKLKKIAGINKYWLWTGIIEKLAENKLSKNPDNLKKLMKIKRDIRAIAKRDLRPEKPESWYKNPKTWLSNYDIQNVMTQYEQTRKYKYRFLGVFPIDFSVQSENGQCMYSDICSIDVNKNLKSCKKFIGLITNLDKHNEPGSHWTSTFLVIDPKLPTYGAYYYDSTTGSIPKYLYDFIYKIKQQCDALFPDKTFVIHENKKQHQYKNSECGVFSMIFQIRWINKHIVKKNNTSFKEIIANPFINDASMLKVRDALFRPSTKMELLQKKIYL